MSTASVKKSSFSSSFGKAKGNDFEVRLEAVPGFTRAEGTNPRTGRIWGYGRVTDAAGNSCWVGDGGGTYGVQVQLRSEGDLVAFLAANAGCSRAEGTKSPRVVTCSNATFTAALAAAGVSVEMAPKETVTTVTAPAAVEAPAFEQDEWEEFQAFKAFKAKAKAAQGK